MLKNIADKNVVNTRIITSHCPSIYRHRTGRMLLFSVVFFSFI